MNYKHFKHFRNSIVLKMLIVQMNGYAFSFQLTFSIQTTYTALCMFRAAYLWENLVNRHKIHKDHNNLNHLNFPHFQHNRIWKVRKMLKVHAPRIAEICLFGFLHLLSDKKPKKCKSHTPKNMNYQHFRHDRSLIMLIMSIVHATSL